jgi:aspartyl-tRNA(Asn)/glutamyl-tRNA(Gln) amidotransferase subunit C
MRIDIDEVKYIAKLAKLRFSEEEARKMAGEFESILSHFETIDMFDLDDVQLDVFSEDLKPRLRKDETSIFEDKGKLFQNVKSMCDSSIKVPKIIE